MFKSKNAVQTMVTLAILVAIHVVLSRLLGFNVWFLKITLSFIPLAIAARLYGWVGGAIVGGLADLIGAIMFPIGVYFPGYTLTSAMAGAAYGLCFNPSPKVFSLLSKLHICPKKLDYKNYTPGIFAILIAVIFVQLVCNLLLNTFWLVVTNSTTKGYLALLLSRAWKEAIMTVVETAVIYPLIKITDKVSVLLPRKA